ncbi:MAG: ArdC family protein [Pirellulales bacterium]
MTKFHGRAQEAAERILLAFERGNLPKALAPVFIKRKDETPCRHWSWSNQLLTALSGFSDARGFRQWQAVGRCVKKGEKGFAIMVPMVGKRETTDAETGEKGEAKFVRGFTHTIVFGFEQTEGAELPGAAESRAFLDALPLVDVARSWGLSVETYNGKDGRAHGYYRHGSAIALGVENLSTWAHELMHAADDRLGQLKEQGQHWRSETVAELGGAIVLEMLGMADDADRGGCWSYVKAYADAAGIEPITACQRCLKRTCDAVALILDTAEQLAAQAIAA